jgi:hypothetical protein
MLPKNVYKDILGNVIHNQKMQTTQMFTDE